MINQKGLLSYVLKSRIYHTYEDAIFVIVNLPFLNSNTHLLLRIACSHYTDFIFFCFFYDFTDCILLHIVDIFLRLICIVGHTYKTGDSHHVDAPCPTSN